ncbi:MAG TPA: HRDC domain-containing protein [Solirubrobacteraceae bacterium]|nr:HRDC domain-containing protein [Solirubrobacteraceae bacterium]
MSTASVLSARARATGRLGFDAEFMGEGRYRALLCLVQVAVDDEDGGTRVEVLDPLEGFDPGELRAVLADPAIEKVLHAGRQDVAILRRTWGSEIRNVFDTQVAAGFAGHGAQTGYGPLLAEVLGRRLAKSASFTRWDRRPLSDEQLSYARDDVADLLALASALQDELRATGRLEWAREECLALEEATDEREPEEAWRRLPRVNRLRPRELAVACELAAWRERTAATEDRPVGSVVSDAALVELARRQPGDRKGLDQIRGLHGRIAGRRGPELLAAVDRGRAAVPPELDSARPPLNESSDAPLIALAEALIRARALEAGLAYELVATRADLNQVIAAARRGDAEPEVRTLRGWRRDLVGVELLELLDGRHALAVRREAQRSPALSVVPVDGG